MLDVIKGFRAKLAEEATPFTEVLDDKAYQPSKAEQEAIDGDEDRE